MATSESKAAQTRREILLRAVDLASVEGLEGLTLGRLAEAISMSKSGLFAHFGSKEELQLAVVEAAREVVVREVFSGSEDVPEGLARLVHLCLAWLRYVEKSPFRGGCFFSAVSAEVDDRPGRVRDLVVDLTGAWLGALETQAAGAAASGELESATDPAQLAFELHAFVQEANWAFQLHGDAEAFGRARRAMRRSLEAAATPLGRSVIADASSRAAH